MWIWIKMFRLMKLLISGGGTGGHVFPAIAIADAFKELHPEVEILFVGARGKMEMKEVPKAGYEIIGLDIGGFQRKFALHNITLGFRLLKSLLQANRILKTFKPDVVVGVGGYASGPILRMAAWNQIPFVIQEQNSYAGVTNKIMASQASCICVAFERMERFFDKRKLVNTGNPVRKEFLIPMNREEAFRYYQLDPNKKTICVFGGSLGARTLNEVISSQYETIRQRNDLQILWQVGKQYVEEFALSPMAQLEHVKMISFIDRMDFAYSIADVAIARAGALTISELAVTNTVAVLVPSPNVAEDHQKKNAASMILHGAARMVLDKNARDTLWNEVMALLDDVPLQKKIKNALSEIAKPNAAIEIAKCIDKLVQKK